MTEASHLMSFELTEVSKDIWDWIKDEQNCVLMTLMARGAQDSVPDP